MRWNLLLAAVAALCVLGVAPSVALATTETGVAHSDVDDFSFASFDAEYTLGRDATGRSTLHTVETLVALFPEFDQNRGFVRELPRVFDDHVTELEVLSVTDEAGAPRPFSTEEAGDMLEVTIAVPVGQFVHGAQSYVITYTQRDVTRFFEDNHADEFYWDVNGTGWLQPFASVSARLTLTDELVTAFNGNAACYRGSFGSGTPCATGTEGNSIIVSEADLLPFENVTIAAGFAAGTFTSAPKPFLQQVPLLLWGGIGSLVAGGALTILFGMVNRRNARTGDAIIAQYEPPAGLSVAAAAILVKATKQAATATLLDLAVRGNLKLLHDDANDRYGALPLNSQGLQPTEFSFFQLIASGGSGAPLWFGAGSTRLGDAARALRSRAGSEVTTAGYLRKQQRLRTALIPLLFIVGLVLLVLNAVVLGNFALMTVLLAVGINLLVWVSLIAFGFAATGRGRSLTGARLHDHLMGLREYIRLAEADRIRMLQSASGAEVSEQQIVQIYERLLPYAVLFGYEREWQAELARYYRDVSPVWVEGSPTFSRSLVLTSFATAVSTSPVTRSSGSSSGSSFSSRSSGSSGGGFSGGGGGGGGGRGI